MAEAAKGRILVVDDEADIRESLEALLTLDDRFAVDLAANAAEGLQKLETGSYDLVLLDLMMPDRSGMEVLEEVRQRDRETPIFMITAYGSSSEVAVEALKRGANDYFPKPWDNEKLLIEIERMIAKRRLEAENRQLKRALKQRYSFPNIVGKSERMLRDARPGSPGGAQPRHHSGHRRNRHRQGTHRQGHPRQLAARGPAVHPRQQRILPPDLLESTLFGHVSGAFTGAIAVPQRLFRTRPPRHHLLRRDRHVSLETQAKLLRVIQDREFMPLGSTEMVKVDVRIIAATNSDLRGWWRKASSARTSTTASTSSTSRCRRCATARKTFPLLIEYFFDQYCRDNDKFLIGPAGSTLKFDPDALQILMDHYWPGNVRELENVSRARRRADFRADPSPPTSSGVAPAGRRHAHPPRRERSPAGRRFAV